MEVPQNPGVNIYIVKKCLDILYCVKSGTEDKTTHFVCWDISLCLSGLDKKGGQSPLPFKTVTNRSSNKKVVVES